MIEVTVWPYTRNRSREFSRSIIGTIVLGQIPGAREVVGILLVVADLPLHQERAAGPTR
jgi:hypothetical protein